MKMNGMSSITAKLSFGLDTHSNYRLYLAHKIKDWAERKDKRPIVAKWTKRVKPEWYNV